MQRVVVQSQSKSSEDVTPLRRWLTALLLVAGVGTFIWSNDFAWEPAHRIQYFAVGAALLLSLWPAFNKRFAALLDHIRRPKPRVVLLVTLSLTALSACYFVQTGMRQGRELIPKMHDEFMHLVQAQLMAHGKLWLPAHPQADFFETFHIFVKPKYAPIYFPGASLFYVPAVWLGLHPWSIAALICGGIVGMSYCVFTELIDGVAGALAAVMALGLAQIHLLSLMTTSHTPILLMGLLVVWAYLHWRRDMKVRWALLLGLLAGWAAIIRPVDALCFLVPLTIAVWLDLWQRPPRLILTTLLVGTCAAAPFLALQLTLDYGVTGHLFQTPTGLYARMNWPQTMFFFPKVDPDHSPPSRLPQFQAFYHQFVVPDVEKIEQDGIVATWLTKRIPDLLEVTVPSALLLLLLPLGITGLTDRPRRAVAAVLPLFLLAYGCFPPFLKYYALFTAPAVMLLVLLGGRAVEEAFPRQRTIFGTLIALVIVAGSLTCLTELNPGLTDPNLSAPTLADIDAKLLKLPDKPALVLFNYSTECDVHEEPVYNLDAPNPDDERIIRAQDLGARDVELFDYYAHHGPPRMVYRYDRATHQLAPLGMTADLAKP